MQRMYLYLRRLIASRSRHSASTASPSRETRSLARRQPCHPLQIRGRGASAVRLPARRLEQIAERLAERASAQGVAKHRCELVEGRVYGVEALDVLGEAVAHALVLGLEAAEPAVPHDQD